jgi:predicted ribosome quality control (RQC) complex YloA/Tae2 family protein
MDATVLQAVLPEVREALGDRPVTKTELVGRFGVLLRFGGLRRPLWVSAHPELSRLSLVDEPPPGEDPRPAPDSLEEPLRRARLVGVDQEAGGRVAILRFRNEDSRHAEPRLVAELIPRFANVILLGNDGRILWCRREFGGNRPRTIRPGQAYEPPAADPGRPLAGLTTEEVRERLAEAPDGPVHARLPRGWGGGAAGFVRVLEEAGVDPVERLAKIAAAVAREPAPVVLRRQGSEELVLFPADPGEVPGWKPVPAGSPGAAVDLWYRPRESGEAGDRLGADLRRVLVRRRGRAAKALRKIEQRLEEAGRADELRARAELLAAHQARIGKGQRAVTLPAFEGTGQVEIELDPKLDAAGNVQRLFKKARKLERGRDELVMQKSIQETELAEADAGIAALEAEPEGDELRELAERLAPSLLRAKPGGSSDATRAEKEPERHPSLPEGFNPRVYDLPGGWVVWVGRSARQNDELSHRRASNRDLWFHARGAQGSHTVLRIASGKGEPPREIIEMTAAIAAFHSKARNSKLVPVSYCEKRYVRKPRGAPVGTASIMREKVVMVEPREP